MIRSIELTVAEALGNYQWQGSKDKGKLIKFMNFCIIVNNNTLL